MKTIRRQKKGLRSWWSERFVTLMVIPERTRRVHKLVVPFFAIKLGAVLFSLALVFLVIIAVDYVHVLRGMAENKRLKGENFKLRREIQLIRNKVDAMDATVERVRNYAKKLQILTGQAGKDDTIPKAPQLKKRRPATKGSRSGALDPVRAGPTLPLETVEGPALPLGERVGNIRTVSLNTELQLNRLQIFLLEQRALVAATPSLLPISGWVSSNFGYRRHPYDGSYRLHAGVDIVAEPGTPVRAPADGTVIYSGLRSGYGKVIVIDHGYGIRTLFAHNNRLFKNSGEKVKRGDTISEVGSTGKSTGPHLHYEVRKNGRPVNPVTFFSGARF